LWELSYEVSVGSDNILSISRWRVTEFDFVSFTFEDHKKDFWLDSVTGCDQGLAAVVHHESGKKDVHCFCDAHWNYFILCIVPVELQLNEDAHQELFEVSLVEHTNSLEVG
jgi:hypothetical protein